MEPLFSHLNHWHWWIFAVILLVLEILTPGTFFMWMRISAVVVGLLMLIVPMGWETQFLLFAIFSVVIIAVGRVYIKRRPIESDRPNLNRRGAQYVGARGGEAAAERDARRDRPPGVRDRPARGRAHRGGRPASRARPRPCGR